LRLSKSYAVATAFSEGKLTHRAAISLLPDLDQVLPTYQNFGNVWKKNPLDWLTANSYEIGRHLKTQISPKIVSILTAEKSGNKSQIAQEFINFLDTTWEQNEHEPSLVVSIPLKIKKVNLIDFLNQALAQHDHLSDPPKMPKQSLDYVQLTNEKVRLDALEKSYNLVLIEAHHPEFEEWQLAECLGVCTRSVKAIKVREENKAKGVVKEDYGDEPNYDMSVHTVLRRYRRYAYLLAKNAARGKFPLNDEDQRKAKGEKITAKFDLASIQKHSRYLSHQLDERGMKHQYANEFLLREAGINRKLDRNDEPDAYVSVMAEAHENFLKNRRKYPPLPKESDDE
jgi:hypothetical protein